MHRRPRPSFPILILSAVLLLGPLPPVVCGEQPSLREVDRVRLAEAFRLADSVGECLWTGWSETAFAVLLVTPDHELLVRHPNPSEDFTLLVERDPLLDSPVWARPRQLPPNLLASFPAVGGLTTVVVGEPEQTGKSSTQWVLSLLHEHFHQLQVETPGYYASVNALGLSGGDGSGSWMLEYPFPYRSAEVGESLGAYRDALVAALAAARGVEEEDRSRARREARDALRAGLSEADDRYLSFQLWQEGVARYTEYRVAELAAERHDPLPAFMALADFVPYGEAANALRRQLAVELDTLDLARDGRTAFYSLGAAEALLLDAVRPGWRRRYARERFDLERFFE